ncbi:C-type lectin domain family 7 member A-like [Pseudoliparis swirei]|uniref:C-type lectin domain family 7 member A-like n=1 Tax=Pseudoliparis swirei TaxID=2059687 RepID=UPI0024BD65AA|nr:C-type lectin domain family 7 member A-like [Pseudoliparis swirei]
MEEELHYVTVTFRTEGPAAHEKPSDLEIIYDEVTTCKEQPSDTDPNTPDNKKKAPRCTVLYLVAAGLGIICVILVSAVVTVTIYFGAAMSEQRRENIDLEDQNRHMWTEKSDLERQNQELTRERDRLHWTLAVILDFENFPVNSHCPQKVCTPCLEGWLLFHSHCYLVSTATYSSTWRTWEGSREHCRQMKAELVVIESREEQEFINNHTNYYNDESHGYWIGLSKMDTWTWVDGSNFPVMFWKAQQAVYRLFCGLIQPRAEPLANWNKASCTMKNRWICETRALIKSD